MPRASATATRRPRESKSLRASRLRGFRRPRGVPLPNALAPDEQQVCDAVHARIAALREKLATAPDACHERREREQANALADEIMTLADRFVKNQLLSVTELDTFVRGSKHAHFGEWLRKTVRKRARWRHARRRKP